MSRELVFYTNPQSRGRIVRWMLEEVGSPYRTEVIEYGESMKSPEYLAINPMGKVPTVTHGNDVISECAAICAYLAVAFPEAGLYAQRAHSAYYRWLFFAAGPLEAAIINRQLGADVAPDQEAMVGYGNYDRVMDALESAVSGKAFIAGDTFSAADVYLGSHIDWGLSFGAIEARPAFEAYRAGLVERPAYLRARELDDALVSSQD